jgi:abhydrolase domain-containing protein 6
MKFLLKILAGLGLVILISITTLVGLSINMTNRIHRDLEVQLSEFGKTAMINGVEVFYRESGDKNKQPLLFIHGFLGSSYDWIDLIKYYDDNYYVVAIDLPGFGNSEKSLTYNYARENQANTVIGLINYLNINDVTLVGHSMGGLVSLITADKAGDKISNLVLIGSAGLETSNPPGALPLFFYDYVVNNYYIQRLFFDTAYSPSEVEAGLVTDQMFKEMFYFNSKIPARVFAKFSVDSDNGYLANKFESISQRTLLIWGSDDGFVSVANGYIMDQRLPNSTLQVIDKAGHLPFDTVPQQVIALIDQFLNN